MMMLAEQLRAIGNRSPHTFIMWLLGSVAAFGSALLALPASRTGGGFGPVGNDSFYHARRMLDAVHDLRHLRQFDALMHAPEGSLIVWPWGFDFLMAAAAKLAVAAGLVADPMTALVFIPPLTVAVAIALVIGIANRLGLSVAGSAVVVACVALSPLTQIIHGVGMLDHHFAEYLAWLASIWALLGWLCATASARDAVLAGAILGFAPALHTDLFILQIPLVVALGFIRLRTGELEIRSVGWFVATMLATTLAVLVPSLAFREGRFEFFTLSWFHLYAAVATGAFCLLAARLPRARHAVATLAGAAVILALPGLEQLITASEFLAGDLELLDRIVEVQSPWQMAMEPGGAGRVTRFYSLLIWISPVVLAGCLLELWRAREAGQASFWAACAIGLALMLLQFRFHNFGSIALYVPVVVWVERAARAFGIARKRALVGLALAMVIAYAPAIRNQLFVVLFPGNDFDYAVTRPLYAPMAEACRGDPGIALATSDDGHYVRFHTECSVIANNFVITRQHEEKIREMNRLMQLTPQELRSANPLVKYVFVHFDTLYTKDARGAVVVLPLQEVAARSPRLVRELLLVPRDDLPEGFALIDELAFSGPEGHPYARLFRLR